ncbi:MAG TPA: hypothetical protein VNI55_09490 [Gaiellaceae bacterium]|nr:hypothetical protein [Gaiellaceae bacterium]
MNEERIGRGPWARLFATAVVPDEGSALAEQARELIRSGAVENLVVEQGTLSASVAGCRATISADPVPPRIWAAASRSARGLQPAVEGREQSLRLEHAMSSDWDEPLVPRARALRHDCSCEAGGACVHVAALGYAVAAEIDRAPSALLRWRGCVASPEAPVEPAVARPEPRGDLWSGSPAPPGRPPRPLPVGAVLKRLGPSGIRAGGDDLVEVLQRAYASFAASTPPER